ncbi:MAG TPA: methylmalonyl-CoA mutase family protein, partial [Mycobacteriales bacterium]|nr:methylmalonyl-CoA mutase family protein [Mycobacteriales bacterium]
MTARVPSFADVPFDRNGSAEDGSAGADVAGWLQEVAAATGRTPDDLLWHTPEGIAVPPVFTADDTDELDFPSTWPGLPPFVRGPYPAMYVTQPWTLRQYAGFSTAELSNAFYRRNL